MTPVEEEVAAERAAQGLPPRIRDPLVLRRVAALVTAPAPDQQRPVMAERPTPMSTSSAGAATHRAAKQKAPGSNGGPPGASHARPLTPQHSP